MSDEEESYLENGINLPIEEGSEDVGDDNVPGVLISVEVQTAIRSTRPARNRQLPARYRQVN
jgi:hypothetical protein